MFNLDMVGRLTDDKLAVYGTGTAKEFDPLVERLCQQHGFKLTKHAGGFGPSDHNSFYAKKIPVLHLFTGTHSDYHRPSDDTEKLNIAGMRRVADMLVDIVQATDRPRSGRRTSKSAASKAWPGPPKATGRPSAACPPIPTRQEKERAALKRSSKTPRPTKPASKAATCSSKFGDNKITILEDFEAPSAAQAGRHGKGHRSPRRQN